MFKFKVLFLFVSLLVSTSAFSQDFSDSPKPDESFFSFFIRITRGGMFPGIKLKAPESVQAAFLKRIKKGSWIGEVNKEQKKLNLAGVDLWQDWYRRKNAMSLLVSETQRADFNSQVQALLDQDLRCKALKCQTPQDLWTLEWNQIEAPLRQAMTQSFVLKAKYFEGQTLFEVLGKQYSFSIPSPENDITVKILAQKDFEVALRELGWDGPVYFRGITGPNPHDPSKHWILLNDDLMKKMSPFEYDVYRNLEYIGILTHELSHVYQDRIANSLQLNLTVQSAEGAMMIEGMAEYYAEKALAQAGSLVQFPHPLGLYAREQGAEIMFREGNEQSGNLFPYTVGMPFVTSLYDLKPTAEESLLLRDNLLKLITQDENLGIFLNREFGK